METEIESENGNKQPICRDIRRYCCEYCGIYRSKKSLIRSHILAQHKKKLKNLKLEDVPSFKPARKKAQNTCDECGASFRKPAYLAQHMKSHSVERPFACPFEDCFFSYRRTDHLNRHLLKHKGTTFDCHFPSCGLSFTVKDNMKRHAKELHGEHSPSKSEIQHACQEPGCGKTFKYACKLKKHEDSHVKVECLELICGEPECMKPFTNYECLKTHIQSCHRYVKCDLCGTQQLRKNIKRHQRKHEGAALNDAFKCAFEGCGLPFSNKSNLDKHVRAVHLELKPFRCRTSGCLQRFSYKHVRDNHEKTHAYEQGDFFETDELWRSRPRGGRKRQQVSIESLTRKRVAPPGKESLINEDGTEYLRWLLSENE